MKARILAAMLSVVPGLFGNPIAVGEFNDSPLSSENVTVRFGSEYARVDGTYVFNTTDRHLWHMEMIVPLVVRDSDSCKRRSKSAAGSRA